MAQVPVPKFPSGGSITCHAAGALVGGRMVRQVPAGVPVGGVQQVNVPAAGGRVCGVAGEDAASGAKVLVHRPSQYVWIEAGATLAPGDLIEATATGTAIVRAAGVVCGEVVTGATVGNLALVDFRPAST
jgi:hypothetical protein